MDFFPLYNSLRIAIIATIIIFFVGIFFAYYIARLPVVIKGIIDVILTLPLVLPPTVVGYILLIFFSPKRPFGAFLNNVFGINIMMTWWAGIFASVVVAFPLMYRTARGAFESFDEDLAYAGETLGLSNIYIFWFIRIPYIAKTLVAGVILSFARALGEYGATSMVAGYTPGKTATISTTVYQLWRINDEKGAIYWVIINIIISSIFLLILNNIERSNKNNVKSKN